MANISRSRVLQSVSFQGIGFPALVRGYMRPVQVSLKGLQTSESRIKKVVDEPVGRGRCGAFPDVDCVV